MERAIAITLAGVWLFAAAAAAAQGGSSGAAGVKAGAADGQAVVARIDGAPIRMDSLQRMFAAFDRDLGAIDPETYYRTMLDRVIDQRLAARAAEADNLDDDPEVQAALEEARVSILANAYLKKAADGADSEVLLRRRYEAMAKDGSFREAKARHILVNDRAKAVEVIQRLRAGADFATLAELHSVGPSAKQGGDLGYFRKEQMVKPFADAAFALEKGKFTEEPVQTKFGWHVILLEDFKDGSQPPFYEQKADLAREARAEAMLGALDRLRSGSKIERFTPDGKPIKP